MSGQRLAISARGHPKRRKAKKQGVRAHIKRRRRVQQELQHGDVPREREVAHQDEEQRGDREPFAPDSADFHREGYEVVVVEECCGRVCVRRRKGAARTGSLTYRGEAVVLEYGAAGCDSG